MHHLDLKTRLGEASIAAAVWTGTGDEVTTLEAHASAGCSICARALVNTRDLAVSLALSGAQERPGDRRGATSGASEGALDAILARTRGALSARRAGGHHVQPSLARADRRRALDPSAAVAHIHIAHPSEVERVREIDALRAVVPRPEEGTPRMLAQLARFVSLRVLFVSIVRGERAVYRAQRGLPEGLAGFRELRREMSYCTHAVSGDAPLVVENAREEPFFRGNRAVTRFGVVSYAGVPLRTAGGIVVGTLCGLDFEPRAIDGGTIAVLEVFARRAVAEIERERTPALLGSILEATSERGDVHGEGFFRDLVAAQRAAGADRQAALLSVRAATAERVLDWIEEHETAGRLAPGVLGVLLPGAGPAEVAERVARLRGAAGADAVTVEQPPGAA